MKIKPLKVWIMVGYPGSGKSRKAREIAESNERTIVVSGDAIREMILGEGNYFYAPAIGGEAFVKELMELAVIAGLKMRYNVVIDEVNLRRSDREGWRRLAVKWGSYGDMNRPAAPEIRYVWTAEKRMEVLLDRRMRNGRGFTREHWRGEIERMMGEWEDFTGDLAVVRHITIFL
jgi:hypothetical protein